MSRNVKGGFICGKTDEFGFGVTKNPMPLHDFSAACLHLLGIDHEHFICHHQWRDCMADVYGYVSKDILG